MSSTSFDSLVARVRGEYCEMPGLRLTVSQACRLWHVDVSTCEMLFEQLVREGFLYKTEKSAYIAQPTTRQRICPPREHATMNTFVTNKVDDRG